MPDSLNEPLTPRGGVSLRKYAAICYALGKARGELTDAAYPSNGYKEHASAKGVLDRTAYYRIAEALGCTEADLAIDPSEFLTRDELNRLAGWK